MAPRQTPFEKKFTIFLIFVLVCVYLYNLNIYTVTAYCNCRYCINSRKFRDKRFASNERTYFGGVAAGKELPFGTRIELIPLNQKDRKAIEKFLNGQTEYTVEDRGFLIKGKKIDIFIPQRMGGHRTARRWGRRRMRLKIKRPKK